MLRPLVRPLVRALVRSPMESRGLRPTLSLDFTNGGVTDSRVTYSGGNNGTITNSAGLIVAATTPRFDYNPVTLAPLGLLVEEARTNLRIYSGDFANPDWGGSGATSGSTNTAPDGTATGRVYTANGASSSHFVTSATSETAGVKANSVYVKAGTQTLVQIAVGGTATPYANFDLTAVTATPFGAGTTATITAAGGGWYRIAMMTTDVAASGVRYGFIASMADGRLPTNTLATSLYFWGAQTEAVSTSPTSYIPTTSAAVTRSADSAVMTGTNFSSWYNQTQGTFVITYSVDGADTSQNRGLSSVDDGSNNNRLALFVPLGAAPFSISARVVSGGSATNPASQGTIALNATAKTALAYGVGSGAAALSVNGAAPATASPVATPVGLVVLRIGEIFGVTQLGGHVQSIRYYPQRLPNATLQGMTA